MRRAKPKDSKPKGDPRTWGRLSVNLTGPVDPTLCQSCGDPAYATWREHGDHDQPLPVFVALCIHCSNQLIEPHPRLYSRVDKNDPIPGTMAICSDCPHRRGIGCESPDLQKNGGRGLAVSITMPRRVHVYGGSRSGWINIWPDPAPGCGSKPRVPVPESA